MKSGRKNDDIPDPRMGTPPEVLTARGVDPDKRRTRKTGWIPDPTGTLAVLNVSVERANLSDRERAVLLLRDAGHSHREIGHQLKIAVSTSKRDLATAKEKIQKTLREMAFPIPRS